MIYFSEKSENSVGNFHPVHRKIQPFFESTRFRDPFDRIGFIIHLPNLNPINKMSKQRKRQPVSSSSSSASSSPSSDQDIDFHVVASGRLPPRAKEILSFHNFNNYVDHQRHYGYKITIDVMNKIKHPQTPTDAKAGEIACTCSVTYAFKDGSGCETVICEAVYNPVSGIIRIGSATRKDCYFVLCPPALCRDLF